MNLLPINNYRHVLKYLDIYFTELLKYEKLVADNP